jgi:hypothetical protein
MTLSDFDEQVLALCDDLWASGERLLASQLFLSAFTGFGTERARDLLITLGCIRDNRDVTERLYLDARITPLFAHLQDAALD